MYQIYVVFHCFDGKREAFVERLVADGILAAIRAEDGCEKYDFYFSEGDKNELLLVETWTSLSHQQAHMTTEHMARFRAIRGVYIESSVLKEFTVK